MNRACVFAALSLLSGCDALLYGEGELYIYNGTKQAIQVEVEGRSNRGVEVSPRSGKRLEVTVGTYAVHAGASTHNLDVADEGLALVSLGGKSCFARADMAGMYTGKQRPVRFLEAYPPQEVIRIRESIDVLPHERLPTERPKSPFAFLRLAEVPCRLLDDGIAIEDLLQKRK